MCSESVDGNELLVKLGSQVAQFLLQKFIQVLFQLAIKYHAYDVIIICVVQCLGRSHVKAGFHQILSLFFITQNKL